MARATTEPVQGLNPRRPAKPNGAAGPTAQEPVGLGSQPRPAAPAAPAKRLVGKQLTDAVSEILAGRSPQDIDPDQGDDADAAGGGEGQGLDGDGEDDGGHQGGRGDDGEGSEQHGGDSGVGGAGDDETTIEEVGKALRLNPTELNKVVLTVDGERVTLGQLKAGWSKVAKFDQERAEFEDRVTTTELEQIDAHRRLMSIIDAMPANALPPAVLQRVNQQYEQNQRTEAALLTKARPGWGDPKYVERERAAMLDLAKRYGFTPAEVGSILDHRQILLLQDFAHALARIDAAKGAARKLDPVGDKPLQREAARAANSGKGAPVGTTKKSQLARRVAELIAKG